MAERYWLQRDKETGWTEVDRAEWIRAEREAGFFPKGLTPGSSHDWDVCATAAFTSIKPDRIIAGKITHK